MAALLVLAACGSGGEPASGPADAADTAGPGRGFPTGGPWVSYYDSADHLDLPRVAATFRIINIDADPTTGNFTRDQVRVLRLGGRNRVLSYLNLGGVERDREYWQVARDTGAELGPRDGYPDEVWMDAADPDWRRLVVGHIAPRLVAQGVDGFYFDSIEVVEGAEVDCDTDCVQGTLDLVAALRAKYPNLLFVMQNATGAQTRDGRAGGHRYADLLDGVTREEVFTRFEPTGERDEDGRYRIATDPEGLADLRAWRDMDLRPGGRAFWVGTEDYANDCANTATARTVMAAAGRAGFAPYVSNKSALQDAVCYW